MELQNLIREKVIGNIKIGTKGENGRPKKLSHLMLKKIKQQILM